MRARRALTGLVAAGFLLAACGGDDGEAGEDTTTTSTTEAADETTTTTEAEATTTTAEATTTTVDEEAAALEEAWDATAVDLRDRVGDLVDFDCPGPAPEDLRNVWGSDPYTDDSSVCAAAVHAGVITTEDGGGVTIEVLGEQESYDASTANGVTTFDYGSWPGSFRVVIPG